MTHLGAMKIVLLVFLTSVFLMVTVAAADLTAINGTWPGNWTPKGGEWTFFGRSSRLDSDLLSGSKQMFLTTMKWRYSHEENTNHCA